MSVGQQTSPDPGEPSLPPAYIDDLRAALPRDLRGRLDDQRVASQIAEQILRPAWKERWPADELARELCRDLPSIVRNLPALLIKRLRDLKVPPPHYDSRVFDEKTGRRVYENGEDVPF